MSRKLLKIRVLYGPSLLFKSARYASGDMDPLAGTFAEKEFADENWRDDSRALQARQRKRRHKDAVRAKVGAAFDAATKPAARSRLSTEEPAVTIRVPSASWVTPANDCFRAAFADRWECFTRDGSEKCAAHAPPRSQPMHLFQYPKGHPEAAQGYPECNEGWCDLIERTCIRIENALDNGDTVKITQIKEKYGTLRFYWNGRLPSEIKAEVGEAVSLAEARSACTCEICGAEGRLYSRGGWLATACFEHAQGEPAPVRPGFENLRIVRRYGAGGHQTVSCRRYDRSTDAFVDVEPRSLGIKEE